MKSRARCVPLQTLLTAARGVKTAPTNLNSLNPNSIVVSTLLQEREPWAQQTSAITSIQSTSQRSPDANMFFEPSRKRTMECEKYQDLRWFQEKPSTVDIMNKPSPAELTLPDIESNDFDLNNFDMQFANRDTPPWGDENHIELFDDDVKMEWNDTIIGEKVKNINNPANEYYCNNNLNYKTGDSVFDTTYNDNYVLRKTDSFDMKNISSTDPAEVLPISYREKLNNYGLFPFDEVKSEVKEEAELYSPGSNTYVVDSDESDLLIGREETIEESNTENIQDITEKLPKKIWQEEPQTEKIVKMEENLPVMYNIEIPRGNVPVALPVTKNHTENLASIPVQVPTANSKPALSLELPKATFEQTVEVNTPDLDFMDLVDFINNDVASDPVIPTTTTPSIQTCQPQPVVPEPSPAPKPEKPKEMRNTYLAIPRQVTSNSPDDQKLPKMVILKTPTTDKSFSEMSTINFDDLADTGGGVSIAERIKTSSKRRRSTKYSISELTASDDDEDKDDNDEDYDHYKEETSTSRRRYTRKRSRSTTSESSCASKRIKEEPGCSNDRYRELRDKNNEASRRSRQNRKDKERDMFRALEEAEKKNVQLKARAEELEKLVTSLRQLLLQVVLKKGSAA